MMMQRLALIVAAVLGLLSGPAQAQSYADTAIYSIEHDGARRTFGLYVPASYRAGAPAPLIVALHGRFSSAKAFHALSGLAAVAEARGAIIAYPETAGGFWNDGGHAALARREPPSDDAGFIAAMIEGVATEYAIDQERLFLAGYDNGGVMAYRLACDGRLGFAGIAVVGALLWDYVRDDCAAAAPAPLLILHGRRDTAFPANGANIALPHARRRLLSVDETLAHWRRVNGCAEGAGATRGLNAMYSGCDGGALAFVGLRQGGHGWFRSGGSYRLNRHGVDAADAIGSFFFDARGFEPPRDRVTGGFARSYIVYVPPRYDAARPTPVVVALHGRPGDGAGMAASTKLNETAARENFIVVYPDGMNGEWNPIADLVGMDAEYPQDDVEFLTDLMDDLRVDLNIDPARMYLTGFSNGGFMTLRMACSAHDRFAAFASVGAAFYSAIREDCPRAGRAPVLLMNGTADVSIHWEGVVLPIGVDRAPRRVSLSVPDSADYFARRNRCGEGVRRSVYPVLGEGPRVYRLDYEGCERGADVTLYIINGGGHNWPGVEGVIPEWIAGEMTVDINANDQIWAFFREHRLSGDN